MQLAYLGLGSNLGDRRANLKEAVFGLATENVRVLRESSTWETDPQDLLDQPSFLNQVVEIETDLSPHRLLAHIAGIEQEMGRVRDISKGPRVIDLDILLLGDTILNTPDLTVPHPAIAQRRFVLEPLAELAPDLRHPISNLSVREMLAALSGQNARRLLL